MFNIGDSVKISDESIYYGLDSIYTPKDEVGVIFSTGLNNTGHIVYDVKWSCSISSNYYEEDLELVHKDVQFHIQTDESMKEVVYFGRSFMIPKDHNYMVITTSKSIKSFKTKPFFGFFWSSKDGECSEIAPEGSCTIHIDIRETLKEV